MRRVGILYDVVGSTTWGRRRARTRKACGCGVAGKCESDGHAGAWKQYNGGNTPTRPTVRGQKFAPGEEGRREKRKGERKNVKGKAPPRAPQDNVGNVLRSLFYWCEHFVHLRGVLFSVFNIVSGGRGGAFRHKILHRLPTSGFPSGAIYCPSTVCLLQWDRWSSEVTLNWIG